MNVRVTESPPSGRLRHCGEKRKKKKKEERKDSKNCPNSRVQMLSVQQTCKLLSFLPSFLLACLPCHGEETIPAALLQAALARTGLIWETKAFQQWDFTRLEPCSAGCTNSSFWEMSGDHQKTMKTIRPKEKLRKKLQSSSLTSPLSYFCSAE